MDQYILKKAPTAHHSICIHLVCDYIHTQEIMGEKMVALKITHVLNHSRKGDLRLQEQWRLPRLTSHLGQQSHGPVVCERPKPVLCALTILKLTSQYHACGTGVFIGHGMQLTRPTPVSPPPRLGPIRKRVEYLWINNIPLDLYISRHGKTLSRCDRTHSLSSANITFAPGVSQEGVLNLFT